MDGRHQRRQAGYYGPYADAGSAESGIADYTIHARVIGLDPTMPNELISSMIFAMLFGILLIAVYFRLYRTIHFRSFGTYTLALASFSLFLGFSIRAGIANSAVPSRTSFIIECIALVLGQLFVLDNWIMRWRDDYLATFDTNMYNLGDGGLGSTFRAAVYVWESRIALLFRAVLLPLSAILYIVGFVRLPDPAVDIPPYSSTKLRGGASFIPLFIVILITLLLLQTRLVAGVPVLNILWSAGVGVLLFVPALYAFALVAVTIDESPLVQSHALFNIAFGLCHALAIAALIATTAFPFWKNNAMQPPPPPEGGPPPPAAVPPRAKPYVWFPRTSADGMRQGPSIPIPAAYFVEYKPPVKKGPPLLMNPDDLF